MGLAHASLWARLGGGGRPGRPHDEARAASEARDGAIGEGPREVGNGGGGGGVDPAALEESGREKAMAASQVGGIIVRATYQASLKKGSLKLQVIPIDISLFLSLASLSHFVSVPKRQQELEK